MINKAVSGYARFLAKNPSKVIIGTILIGILLSSGSSQVEVVEQNTEDFLPDSIPSIGAFETISGEFASTGSTYTILIESDPSYANSNEIRDVREPEMIRFIQKIDNDITSFNDVESVSSLADFLNGQYATKAEIKQEIDSTPSSFTNSYISDDYTATLIRVNTAGLSTEEKDDLARVIKSSIERSEKPPGIRISYTGDVFINQAIQNASQDTLQTTSLLSLIGVIVLVVLLFRSVFYGGVSLLALIFGIAAGYGVFGLLGFDLTSTTSGAVSMGIGIAIDFGIQIVSRYREERGNLGITGSVENTMVGVFSPMTVALLSALIGFTALSFGRITFLSSLGTILSMTTLMAYVGALTLIPATLVLWDRKIAHRVPSINDITR